MTPRRGLRVGTLSGGGDTPFAFPLELITQTLAILAVKRAGKSNTAVVMAEEMHRCGLPWVAIDPKGDWWGIRADGEGSKGLPVLVMGGLHGDVPLTPTAGRLVADLVVEHRLTCVLDVSEFTKADQIRFLTAFVDRLYRTNKEPLHVFCEEADEYIPQRVDRDETKVVRAFEMLVKRGGFRGLGITLITQRSAALNKDVLTQIETLIAMRTPSPQDRAAIKGWLDFHDAGKAVLDSLPKLSNGQGYVISPQWLDDVALVKFRQRGTYDSGSTPKHGESRKPATLADIDLGAVEAAMAETIEKAEAEDPKHLRSELARLRADLRKATADLQRANDAQPEPEVVYERRFTEDDQVLVKRVQERFDDLRDFTAEMLNGIREELAGLSPAPVTTVPPPPSRVRVVPRADPPRPVVATQAPVKRATPGASDGTLSGPERKILTALAQHGPKDKITLAILTNYSHKGGAFNNPLGSLRSKGYVEKGNPVAATQEGIDALGDYEPLPVGRALLEWWLPQLSGPEQKIVGALDMGGPMSKDALAEATGYAPTGGAFNNPLGHLRTLGIVQRGLPIELNPEMVG